MATLKYEGKKYVKKGWRAAAIVFFILILLYFISSFIQGYVDSYYESACQVDICKINNPQSEYISYYYPEGNYDFACFCELESGEIHAYKILED